MVFTSPLTVKVYEEVKEKRKEEVDLETGRRTSFVEEVRYEVLDLTGDTPDRRAPLQPLPCQSSEAAANTSKPSKPSGPTKSPLPPLDTSHLLPDVSVLCLSSPTPTRGPTTPKLTRATRIATRVLTPGLRTSRTPQGAVARKWPLLR